MWYEVQINTVGLQPLLDYVGCHGWCAWLRFWCMRTTAMVFDSWSWIQPNPSMGHFQYHTWVSLMILIILS